MLTLTLLLPQNVDLLTFWLEGVSLPLGFSMPESGTGTPRGGPGSIDESISPIDRWDSVTANSWKAFISFPRLSNCSCNETLEPASGWGSTFGFNFTPCKQPSLGDPISESFPPTPCAENQRNPNKYSQNIAYRGYIGVLNSSYPSKKFNNFFLIRSKKFNNYKARWHRYQSNFLWVSTSLLWSYFSCVHD